MTSQMLIFAGVALLLFLVVWLFAGKKTGAEFPVVAKALLTKRERTALEALEAAFPDCRIFPQVAMGALIQPEKGLPQQRRAALRNRFSQKIVDFVVEGRADNAVRFLVEVDDRTHNADKDRGRDAMTLAAGYRTVRIPAGSNLDVATVRALCSPT